MRDEIKGIGDDDNKGGTEENKQGEGDVGDDVNIKRSIEMKNGIALRSMNNFHKGTNAISLNNYKVSEACPFIIISRLSDFRVILASCGSYTTSFSPLTT